MIFELPGFTASATGAEQSSLDELRSASDTSYFKDKDSLWVKLVVAENTGLVDTKAPDGAGAAGGPCRGAFIDLGGKP